MYDTKGSKIQTHLGPSDSAEISHKMVTGSKTGYQVMIIQVAYADFLATGQRIQSMEKLDINKIQFVGGKAIF